MRRNALASSLVAVAMMAVAFMVVAFLRTTRIEEPEVAGGGEGSDPGGGKGSGVGSQGAAQPRGEGRPTGRGSGGAAPSASRRGGANGGGLAMSSAPLAEGDEPGVDGADLEAEPWPLTMDGIRGAVNSQIDPIKHCYEQWLKLEPDIAGRVVVTFTVGVGEEGDGEVTHLELADSDLEHPFMEGCVLNVFQGIPFEPPEDGGEVEINYPLMFDSHGDEEAAEE